MNLLKRITVILSICCIAFPAQAMDNGDGNPGWASSVWNRVCEEAPAVCFALGVGIAGTLLYGLYHVSTERAPEMDPSNDMHPKHDKWVRKEIERLTAISSDDVQPYVSWYSHLLDARREDIVNTLFKCNGIFHNRMLEKIDLACRSNDITREEAESRIRTNIKHAVKIELTKVSTKDIQHVIPAIIALTKRPSNVGKNVGDIIAAHLIPEIVRGKLALIKKCLPRTSKAEFKWLEKIMLNGELQCCEQIILNNVNRAITQSPPINQAIRIELTTVSSSEIQHVIPAIIALTMKPNNLGKDIGIIVAAQLIPELVKGKLAIAKKYLPNIPEAELQRDIVASINQAITQSPNMQSAQNN